MEGKHEELKPDQKDSSSASKKKPGFSLIAFAGDNSIQIDHDQAAKTLKGECPRLLLENEDIVMAFQDRGGHGRDDFFFTTRRIVIRDKMLLTGKKTSYRSVPYSSIKAFSIETQGTMDANTELKVYGPSHLFSFGFVPGQVNILAIQKHFNTVLLTQGRVGGDARDGAVATKNDASLLENNGEKADFFGWLGGNHGQINAAEVEQRLKNSNEKDILLPEESVDMAFQCGRDLFLLTSHRIMKIDAQNIRGKKREYLTILWDTLRAVSVETAGTFDLDCDITIFTTVSTMTRLELDLRSGKSDIFAAQKFFADKLLGMDNVDQPETPIEIEPTSGGNKAKNLLAWLGDNSSMIESSQVETRFRTNPPILQHSERVEMAFKGRRDMMVFTNKRLLLVDTHGFSGKRVEYFSLPWRHVQCFAVRSAGAFMDFDAEMIIWTDFNDVYYPPAWKQARGLAVELAGGALDPDGNFNDVTDVVSDQMDESPLPRRSMLEMDFNKDKVDLMAVKRYLAERCLPVTGGKDCLLPSDVLVSPDVMQPSPPNAVEKFMSWIGDDNRAIDPKELDVQLHEHNSVLQSSEHVVLAYKTGRDTLAFTTKRVLIIDAKGVTGKKILWMSVPYTSIRAFSVESSGKLDLDTQLKLYCKIYWLDGYPQSKIKQDFRKASADVFAIQKLLSVQVFGAENGSSTLESEDVSTDSNAFANFLSWMGDDGVEVSAEKVNEKLHKSPAILQDDETADVCYKAGRDLFIFTTKRILVVDVKGISGKRIAYDSFPLRYCKAFKVQSPGLVGFLGTPKVSIYFDIPGKLKISLELELASGNIWAMQKLLNDKIIK